MSLARPQSDLSMTRLKNIPALQTFHNVVTDKLHSGGDEAFWDCEGEFSTTLNSQFLTAVVNLELESLAADPLYVPEQASELSIGLVHTAQYSLEVWLIPANTSSQGFVRSSASHCMFGLVSAGRGGVEFFRQPQPFPDDIFDRERRLVRDKDIMLSQGELTGARAARDMFLLRPAADEQIYLFFRSRPILRFIWEYSTHTLAPQRIMAADPSSSRLQYAARLLSAMSCTEAIPNLFRLMDHADHFVRWTAVQSVLALDLQKGLEALKLAEKDKHPHVRNAAAKALRLAEITDKGATHTV